MKLEIKPTEEELEILNRSGAWGTKLSGRVLFDLVEIYYNRDSNTDEICFNCGPETEDGYFLDFSDCGLYPQLEELLKDFNTNIGAAENYHIIYVEDNDNYTEHLRNYSYEIWNKVKKILIDAGAVEMEK